MWGPRGHLGLISFSAAFITVGLLFLEFDDTPFEPSAMGQAVVTATLAVWAAIAAASK